MTHNCHDNKCRRDREGLFLPVCGTNKPNIIIETYVGWTGDDKEDIERQGRKMARYCYSNVSSTFMKAFREEYTYLNR